MEAIYRIDCLLALCMAGGLRPPLLDYDLLVLGGRPKAALADERLTVAHSFFQALWAMVYQASSGVSRLHLTCHNHKLVFYLARLWRALISSIYIYIIYIYPAPHTPETWGDNMFEVDIF